MRINKLAFLGFYLNGALGSSKYDDISIDEVKAAIRDRSIFGLLESRLGDDVDTSLLDARDRQELMQEWASLADSVNESRKLCVDRNGLCLLVAYLLEGMQRRSRESA
jgi:hypothetical protein